MSAEWVVTTWLGNHAVEVELYLNPSLWTGSFGILPYRQLRHRRRRVQLACRPLCRSAWCPESRAQMPGVELLLAAAILPFDDKFTGNGIGDVQDGTSMVVGRRGHRNGELENSNLRLASG